MAGAMRVTRLAALAAPWASAPTGPGQAAGAGLATVGAGAQMGAPRPKDWP